jgi:predicted DNA-binding transcriptional regulator YafY
MRADRLLSILLLLQVHRRMTARELATRLEVSERTIHRDMEALSVAGVPVYAQRGAGGGWILPDAYRTHVAGLTDVEAQTLFLTTPPCLLADLGLEKAADAALVKLLASLPVMQRRDAEYARQRIHVDSAGWRSSEESVPFLTVLQEAVWQDRRVRIRYGESGTERVIDPLGLVAKGRLWYLVGAVQDEPRTYRISRVQDATVLEEPCVRPPNFDLAVYWRQSSASFVANLPRYPITVRAAPAILPRLEDPGWYTRVEGPARPEDSGWVRVRLICQTEEEACRFALGFGPWIEVLEPESLRGRVAQLAAQVVDRYANESDTALVPAIAASV